MDYERLMYTILKRYGLYSKRDDYIDLCYIGYTKAIKNYNKDKANFTTYVYRCMENEIRQYLRKEMANKRQHDGHDFSFDYEYDEKGHDLEDIVSNGTNIEEEFIKKEQEQEVLKAFTKLTKREQEVIRYTFGLGCEHKTQNDISKLLRYSQAQISKIKNKSLKKLKGMIE